MVSGLPCGVQVQVQLHWSLRHVQELIPTAAVARGVHASSDFADARTELYEAAADFCAASHADAIIVLRGTTVLHEQYFGDMTPTDRHLVMSVSKWSIIADGGRATSSAACSWPTTRSRGRGWGCRR